MWRPSEKLFPRSKFVEHVQNNHSDWGIEEPFPGAKIQGPCHDQKSDWRRSEKLSPRSKAQGPYCRDVSERPPRAGCRGAPGAALPLDIVSLISSKPDSSFPDFVGDLDAILSRNHLRLLPILGRGPLHTVNDLLYTPGIDIAVVQADAIGALDHPARRRLRYIAKVYDEQFHVVAGREITDIRQLDGRKVNIDGPGTGTYLTARNVFKRLKVTPEFTTDDQATSFRKLSAGEIAAAVYVAPVLLANSEHSPTTAASTWCR